MMQNLFFDTHPLDTRANTTFKLSSEILMENAARGMLEFIAPKLTPNSKILLLCGNGDNGADCLALARMLYGSCALKVLLKKNGAQSLCSRKNVRAQAANTVLKPF